MYPADAAMQADLRQFLAVSDCDRLLYKRRSPDGDLGRCTTCHQQIPNGAGENLKWPRQQARD
jgi:hypothetical protein